MKKINLLLLCGGRSVEHEISLISSRNIANALDAKKYNVLVVCIDKQGKWHYQEKQDYLVNESDPRKVTFHKNKNKVYFDLNGNLQTLCLLKNGKEVRKKIDVVFPILHGTYGEDGLIQGFLETLSIPYVGSGVLGSAVGMDKEIAKQLMDNAGVPVVPSVTLLKHDKVPSYDFIARKLGKTIFVKAASLGSSVGVFKVKNSKEYRSAIKEAFLEDEKVLIERGVTCREIECAVLGNEKPKATIPGEIVLHGAEFYSYEAKYCDAEASSVQIPAKITKSQMKKIQDYAVRAYQALNLSGLSRVDFFLTDRGEIFCNEVNTLPGFTNISMYPKMWENMGVSYSKLLDELVTLAFEK